MKKTLDIQEDWKPEQGEASGQPVAFTFGDDDLREQGWRLVGRDEKGQPIYAPPTRSPRWFH